MRRQARFYSPSLRPHSSPRLPFDGVLHALFPLLLVTQRRYPQVRLAAEIVHAESRRQVLRGFLQIARLAPGGCAGAVHSVRGGYGEVWGKRQPAEIGTKVNHTRAALLLLLPMLRAQRLLGLSTISDHVPRYMQMKITYEAFDWRSTLACGFLLGS